MRFLGVGLTSEGRLTPWTEDHSLRARTHSVLSSLGRLGFGSYPAAVSAALTSTVLPAAVFGGELWGLHDLAAWVRGRESPFHCSRLLPVLEVLKREAGLPPRAFAAPVYHLFSLLSCLEMLLPRVLHLLATLSPS